MVAPHTHPLPAPSEWQRLSVDLATKEGVIDRQAERIASLLSECARLSRLLSERAPARLA
jgi:hypothetical protein